MSDSAAGAGAANDNINLMRNFANGNFGSNATALTGAANGDFLASNPFTANGQLNTDYINQSGLNATAAGGGFANNPFTANGGFDADFLRQIGLSGMAENGGLNTGYIDNSLLNRTAAGDFLTADSNPYIRDVAQRGADSAQAAINAQFGAAGRSNGSGLYAQLFGQGISDASNSVYAQNYANERQLQQAAQNSLLGANQSAQENALARQLSAQNSMLGARENAYGRQQTAYESEAQRQQAAQNSLLGANQTARENALSRQMSSYDAERQRQQAAAGGLLNTQLAGAGQIPSLISSMIASNQAGLSAGQYQDNADMERLRQYTSILSGLSSPYGIQDQNSTTTTKSSGLGSVLGTVASLGSAIAAPFTGGASLLGGAAGGAGAIMGGGFNSALGGMATGALPQWLGK
ncbi:hypothetical protein SAMN02927924_01434 [Sphingobium faniae]|nr:hypothetical protein SAMN02927924_01434 [Sphingobium faniae]